MVRSWDSVVMGFIFYFTYFYLIFQEYITEEYEVIYNNLPLYATIFSVIMNTLKHKRLG